MTNIMRKMRLWGTVPAREPAIVETGYSFYCSATNEYPNWLIKRVFDFSYYGKNLWVSSKYRSPFF
jgi:hypothetical protein